MKDRTDKTHRVAWKSRDGRTFYGPPTTLKNANEVVSLQNKPEVWQQWGYYIHHWVARLPEGEEE